VDCEISINLYSHFSLIGFDVCRTTVRNILIANGYDPNPDVKTTWKQFLKAHWDIPAACDFFSIELDFTDRQFEICYKMEGKLGILMLGALPSRLKIPVNGYNKNCP
jgi:hypothetical protein